MGAMKTETCNMEKVPYIWRTVAVLGSVSSRECLDATAILATFTAGCTCLVACT